MSSVQKTTVDWLRFRVQADPMEVLEAFKPMFDDLGPSLRFKPLERGILGFQQAGQITIGDMPVARMDYGGESQRGWVRVDVPGKGCEWIPQAELRRLDLALTTWDGEVTHDLVVKAHDLGRFVTRGRPPVLTQITSSNPRAGKTCYIGKRERSDKFMRCYEKGFEMAAAMASRCPGDVTHIDNKALEDIYRCEVEFKASATDITWDAIGRRDQYFAGAYPFCADVLPGVECDILMRRPEREPMVSLAAALENCRIQFGPTLFTALAAYQGDMTAVWDKVIGHDHCQTLLEAGVLLVDHETV
jgi:DNA relaxase NicK